MSGAAAGETRPSQRTADIAGAELAGKLAHERTADITAAELAGSLSGASARLSEHDKQILAARGLGVPTPKTHASTPRLESTDTGFDWSSSRHRNRRHRRFLLIAAGGLGTACRARIRVAR